MRRSLSFDCEGSRLAATLDEGHRASGLLIVSGGNEIRIGAHRAMAQLAATIAAHGHPVLRFDRRGIGDSEGTNTGFAHSAPDLLAALASFRAAQPGLETVVAFGNCDAATALALHATPVDARVLANPWVVEPVDDLPPPAAIKARYVERLRDPAAWRALLSGRIDIAKLAKGLGRLAVDRSQAPDTLACRMIDALGRATIPTTIVLARGDATAIAFDDAWRNTPPLPVVRLDSNSHSFANDGDLAQLEGVLLAALREFA